MTAAATTLPHMGQALAKRRICPDRFPERGLTLLGSHA